MSGLAWIQVTANGQSIPVRIDDLLDVQRVGGTIGGSRITFKTQRPPLEVSETPAQIFTAIDAKWTQYTTALGDPV